jgi:hypothetical protein
VPWGAPGACLCHLEDTLPYEGEPGSPIALALHELQAMDLAFGHAVAPLAGEPGGDRSQVLLQSTGKPGELIDATVHRLGHPQPFFPEGMTLSEPAELGMAPREVGTAPTGCSLRRCSPGTGGYQGTPNSPRRVRWSRRAPGSTLNAGGMPRHG